MVDARNTERESYTSELTNLWAQFHMLKDKVLILEERTASIRDTTNKEVSTLIERQDKHEKRFEATFDKFTTAVESIQQDLNSFISGKNEADKVRDAAWKIAVAIALPVGSLIWFLLREYFNHI